MKGVIDKQLSFFIGLIILFVAVAIILLLLLPKFAPGLVKQAGEIYSQIAQIPIKAM